MSDQEPIDWTNLGARFACVEDAFEEHRRRTVAHFIKMRHFDAELARYSLAEYLRSSSCLFPKIADDVRAEWARVVAEAKSAEAESALADRKNSDG